MSILRDIMTLVANALRGIQYKGGFQKLSSFINHFPNIHFGGSIIFTISGGDI